MNTHNFNTKNDRKPESLTEDEILDFNINYERYDPLRYSSDQMNVNYPNRFPVVNVEIVDVPALNRIADYIMHEDGKGGYWDEGFDEIWYNFEIDFYQLEKNGEIRCGNVVFSVDNHPDVESSVLGYLIGLNEEQKAAFVKWFTDYVCPYNGKTALEIFDEARSEMMDRYADGLF